MNFLGPLLATPECLEACDGDTGGADHELEQSEALGGGGGSIRHIVVVLPYSGHNTTLHTQDTIQ